MNKDQITLGMILRSKLALSLIPIFVLVVAVPLAVTVLVVGHVGQDQIVATARTMERVNVATVEDAGQRFERLGQAALQQSSSKISDVCLSNIKAASHQTEKTQAASIAESGKDFADVSQSSFDGAMHQSLGTNKQIIGSVGTQMGKLFASSENYTQDRVGDRVQTAILDQINDQMNDRATQLASLFDSYIQTNLNYLGLTAEMLNIYENNSAGQQAVLDALVRRYPMMTVVTVLDDKGNVTDVSAADRMELPTDLANQSYTQYFKTAMSDKTYVGVDSYPTDSSAPTLRLAVPLELYRGKAIGALTTTVSLDDLWDTIRDAHFGKLGYAFVTDSSGYPFLAPRHFDGAVLEQSAPIDSLGWTMVVAQPQSEVMAPIQAFKADISSHTLRSLVKMHGDIKIASALATAKLLSNAALLRVTGTKRLQFNTKQLQQQLDKKTAEQADEQQRQMQSAIQSQILQQQAQNDSDMVTAAKKASLSLEKRIPLVASAALIRGDKKLGFYAVVILICSCGLSCLIGFLLAGALVIPIIRLSQGTQWLAKGDLDKRVDERAPAEIGDLAIAFNMMAESLQKSRADLTDAESQLVQSAKLASLGTLSAGVAHELNQPVAIVRGLAQQLKADDTVPLEVREDLTIIEGQTSRMMKIITHLRTFCRTGGFEMVDVDANQVIRDCFILIDAQLRSHGVSVVMELNEGSTWVRGDANELEQVFINLITNARDAMEGQAEPVLTIRSKVTESNVVLEFHDNGLGIPEIVSEHIFDPFFTTKEVGKGTGLGLSISHGLIQKHHGTITARNDAGAVFTITLPLLNSEVTKIEQAENSARFSKAA